MFHQHGYGKHKTCQFDFILTDAYQKQREPLGSEGIFTATGKI